VRDSTAHLGASVSGGWDETSAHSKTSASASMKESLGKPWGLSAMSARSDKSDAPEDMEV